MVRSTCPWCREEFEWQAIYHVCKDGTTLSDRIAKTSVQIKEEHARQDRIREGYKAMEKPAKPQSMAISPYQKLPDQPNTTGFFRWNADDLKFADELKIKI
jgi:hypothetical protein